MKFRPRQSLDPVSGALPRVDFNSARGHARRTNEISLPSPRCLHLARAQERFLSTPFGLARSRLPEALLAEIERSLAIRALSLSYFLLPFNRGN